MKKLFLISVAILLFAGIACKKEAGEGGNSSIKGKIWVENYNTLNNSYDTYFLKGEYPGADEDVYIIYGNDISYGNKVKSGPDGVFEFKYLRPGDYKVYVQSKDTNRAYLSGAISGIRTVDVSVTISKKKETVETGNLVIYK